MGSGDSERGHSWQMVADNRHEFDIKLSPRVFSPENGDLVQLGTSGRRIVFFDHRAYQLYGDEARKYFIENNIEATMVVLESNEGNKDLSAVEEILHQMEQFGILRRAEPVIGVGGGILLDLVGFAASIYRRGVPYIRVPTTLLALVDAGVGAKTGINHFSRRNRLGSYYPPVATYLDTTFIKSLSASEVSNGLAEVLKLAVIKDLRLFSLLEGNADVLLREKLQNGEVALEVINRAITGMVQELSPNLWEMDLKRCVDFGHSFSPLIEMLALPE